MDGSSGGFPLLPGEEVRWVGGFSGALMASGPPPPMPPASQRLGLWTKPFGTSTGALASSRTINTIVGFAGFVFVMFFVLPIFASVLGPTGFPAFFPFFFVIAAVAVARSRGLGASRSRSSLRSWSSARPAPTPVVWGRPGTYLVTSQRVMVVEPSGLVASLPVDTVVPQVVPRSTGIAAVSFATRSSAVPTIVFEAQPAVEIDRIMGALAGPPGPPVGPTAPGAPAPVSPPSAADPSANPRPANPYRYVPPSPEPAPIEDQLARWRDRGDDGNEPPGVDAPPAGPIIS